MQHLIQASPIMEKLKNIQHLLSFRMQLTTSQKVTIFVNIKFHLVYSKITVIKCYTV